MFDGVKHLLDSKDKRRFTLLNRPSVYGVAVFNRVNAGWGCGGVWRGVFDEEVG